MNQTPMFQRTGSASFPEHLKCLVTGEPKSGKTSFLGTVPGVVVLDTEPHANNLQSVAHLNLPYSTITTGADIHRMLMILSDDTLRNQAAQNLGMPKIEAVAIDTLDTLQTILKRDRMKETRQSKFLRDDWGWLKEEMETIVNAFTALPLHVFFMVHSKTKEVGSEESPKTIILPGLEGKIAETVAGMVGYSLMSFRRQEIQPDGKPKTSYFLRAEGDEVYGFLGNRAAGRLPDIIDPSFPVLHQYAVEARKQVHNAPEVNNSVFPVTARTQPVAQDSGQQSAAPAAPAPVAPGVAPAAPATPPTLPGDDEPVNLAAMSHVKKVYDALAIGFPEDLVRSKNLGEARMVVKMWKALQEDVAHGKSDGRPAQEEMLEFLGNLGWLPTEGAQAQAQAAAITPDVTGTIDQVMAYVGDDLAKAQEAYGLEIAKDKPRASLITKLTSLGVTVQTPVENAPVVEQPVEAPVEAPEPVQEAVTPAAPPVDEPVTEAQAEATVKEVLGGEVVETTENPETRLCETCNKPVDDLDIARLSETRFKKWLCVEDYIQTNAAKR